MNKLILALVAAALFSVRPFGAVSGTIPKPTAKPPVSLADPTAAAQAFCQAKLGLWQKRLKLNRWKISLSIVRENELMPDTWGDIFWHGFAKTAAIRVLSPLDYPADWQIREIREKEEGTVVHELLHLALRPIPKDKRKNQSDKENEAEERVVNQLRDALVALDQGSN